MARKPIVALVGRPNVGKSTLFNRLVGERLAIVEEIAGTTRDRLYADVEWGGRVFTLIDTGGIVLGKADEMTQLIRQQAQIAIDEADVIVLMCDILSGITTDDQDIADLLRRTSKPVLVAINKADNLRREVALPEFYALGLGEPLPVSAIQGMGTGELLDAMVRALPPLPPEEEHEEHLLHIAIVGRTNVGKSSLLNALLGEQRVIVSETPGATRDAIDMRVRHDGEDLVLIDTAGIRRRGQVAPGVEKYSVLRTLKAIQRADVALLMLDATMGVIEQDMHIASYVLDAAKSVVVLLNKWDLVEKSTSTLDEFEKQVRERLNFMPYVPVLSISALSGQRVGRILPLAKRIYAERHQRLSTSEINDLIRNATAKHSPPSGRGTKLRFYFGTQAEVDPPTFVFFVNDNRLVHLTYKRYLENEIRARYPFEGTPIRLFFRSHDEKKR
jgi:GTP-binding protein